MPTICRLHHRASPLHINFFRKNLAALPVCGALYGALIAASLTGASTLLPAQVLARPGLAGSGVTLEPWWKRAVFYRIQPELFQDSDGDGHGDVPGIAQRLNYLQSLGVDAIILRPSPASVEQDFNNFDELARQASGARIRVLVEIGALAAPPHDLDADYLAAARSWLTQGAAGLFVDTPALAATVGDDRTARLLHDLRSLVNSFPGERLLLASDPGNDHTALLKPLAQYTQLMASPPITAKTLDAAPLRTQLEAAFGISPASHAPAADTPATEATDKPNAPKPATAGGTRRRQHAAASPADTSTAKPAQPNANLNPLLRAAPVVMSSATGPEQQTTLEASLAAMLLGSRAAVILNAGEEIGLSPRADGTMPVMQWTPSNLTPKPKPPEPAETEPTDKPAPAPTPTPPSDPNVYGAYKPYVPPPPVKRKPKPADDAAPAPIDPNSLPGFTTGELSSALSEDAAVTAKINVATEDADPNSLLSFYRKLIQYHHGNPTLHNGVEYIFNHDTLNAITWMRRAQAGTARSPAILGVCNLSDKPLALSISDDLRHLQIRPGSFRTLVTSSSKQIFPQAYDHISLPPYTVFLGEMYH